MSAATRREYLIYRSDDVDVLEYPPHMPGYFTMFGLRVRTANGRAHTVTLSERELVALRGFLNRMDLSDA